MKGISWLGSSRDDVRAFPANARREAGFQLDKVQHGEDPDDWKPMPTVGSGVREIRIRDAAGAFRVIYVATHANAIYVLHAFTKKTMATSTRDLQLARQRYQSVRSKA